MRLSVGDGDREGLERESVLAVHHGGPESLFRAEDVVLRHGLAHTDDADGPDAVTRLRPVHLHLSEKRSALHQRDILQSKQGSQVIL